MSMKRVMAIECPRCSSQREVMVWSTINIQLSPEVKEELLEAKTNLFQCEMCSFEQTVPVALMYHDMEKEFCVYFLPFSSMEWENISSEFTVDARLNLRRTGVENPPDYFRNVHIVFSMDELVRYVVFRDKLAQQKAVK